MRNRTIEAGMVLAIGVSTMFTVGSYIHSLQTGKQSQLDSRIGQLATKVEHWVIGHEPGANTYASSNAVNITSNAPENSRTTTQDATTAATKLNSNSLDTSIVSNGADQQHLLAIAQDLSKQLTAADWVNIVNQLESSSPTQAEQSLTKLLNAKLSPDDIRWLQTHFTGKQAFNQDDVQLLQNTLKEMNASLTPDEQQLLRNELSQLGVELQTNH